MWKLPPRSTPLTTPMPGPRAVGLRAITRLWRRGPRRPTPVASTPCDYANTLRQLKAQHAALSADRTQLDHTTQQQSERVADLEARLHFLLRTVHASAGRSPSDKQARVTEVRPSTATPGPISLQMYQSALAEAQHWQDLAEELQRELHAVNQLVRIDSLTGLHNRRSFDEHLPRELARSQRVGEPVCLLMIDIDHFKRLNDLHGHPAGDAVLRRIASSISSCTRPSDHVARYGGEEFVVVLSGIDIDQAIAVADRIRRQIAQLDLGPAKSTVSIGVAEHQPNQESGSAELITEADRALYVAKHSGRNRVRAARHKS